MITFWCPQSEGHDNRQVPTCDTHDRVSSVIGLSLPLQVIWSAAVGDPLSGLHAISLQNQPRGAGVCHQWRQDGSPQGLSGACVSTDTRYIKRDEPRCEGEAGHSWYDFGDNGTGSALSTNFDVDVIELSESFLCFSSLRPRGDTEEEKIDGERKDDYFCLFLRNFFLRVESLAQAQQTQDTGVTLSKRMRFIKKTWMVEMRVGPGNFSGETDDERGKKKM